MTHLLVWILVLLIFQIGFLPFSILVGKRFYLSGILLSKIWGVLLLSFCIWVVGSLKILPFTFLSAIFLFGLLILGNFLLFMRFPENFKNFKSTLKTSLLAECIFFIPFVIWVVLRGFNPNIDNFEKFMDFGFVNAVLRSSHFPPHDMWFAGESINYYYFGHLVGAVLIKLTQVPSSIGYNLYMAAVLALSCSTAFTLGATIMQFFSKRKKVLNFAGLLTILLVNFSGTLYTFSFLFQKNLEPFWFWRSIRLIPGSIHEFPQYSFAVSDLHAHMLNIPFVLLAMTSLVGIVFILCDKTINKVKLSLLLLLHGWILGLCFMTSAWDLPMYLGLSGLVLFYIKLQKSHQFFLSVFESLVQFFIIVLGIAFSVILFWIKFDFSISQGVHFVHSHTNVLHYLTLWLPAFLTIIFGLLFWLYKWRKEESEKPGFELITVFACWGIFLTLVPEVIYIKDIYGGDFYRGNTILKFYYQAFIVLGVVCAVMLAKLFTSNISNRVRLTFLLPIIFWSACLIYPFQIIPSYYNQFREWYGLDGSFFMQRYYPADYEAINWINKNISDNAVLLEAAGDSYTYQNRVSTFTGIQTVQGWFVHEWLWRGGAEKPGQRANEVREIYEHFTLDRKRELIKKYNIQYIYIGNVEKEKYPLTSVDLLTQLGEIVYENEQVKIIKLAN